MTNPNYAPSPERILKTVALNAANYIQVAIEFARQHGLKVGAIAAFGGIALSGCAPNEGTPQSAPTSVTQETEAPETHQTCIEFAAESKANRPAPGSEEWNTLVQKAENPYVAGQTADQVIQAHIDKSYEWIGAGVQDLPTDPVTIEDCVNQIGALDRDAEGNVGDVSESISALDDLLGGTWRSDVYAEAGGHQGPLGAAIIDNRKESMRKINYRVLITRMADNNPTRTASFTTSNIVVNELPGGVVGGSWTTEVRVGGVSDSYNGAATLAPNGDRWEDID